MVESDSQSPSEESSSQESVSVGTNSSGDDATIIDLRNSDETSWDRQTGEKHRFKLKGYHGYVLEIEDVHFNHNSAVLLPDYEPDKKGRRESVAGRVTGLAVLRACYLHVQEEFDQLLLIVGHTDTTGKASYNMKLSKMRADGVQCALTGDRNGWVKVALKKHHVMDIQQILKWIVRVWGWPCDGGPVDDKFGPRTEKGIRAFQSAYNNKFDASIKVDGIVGRKTFGAIFDLYMRELQYLMETDKQYLEQYRSKLKFLDDSHKAVGCGEDFPIEQPRQDGYYSSTNRRVELLFFDPSEKPSLDCRSGDSHDKDKCEVYDPRLYKYQHLQVEPVPRLVWIDLQTVDMLGYRVPNMALHFSPEGEGLDESCGEYDIKTDEQGYWSGRVNTAGKIHITMADGTPVRLGSQSNEGDLPTKTAVIDPRIAGRTITDIVVATEGQPPDLPQQRDQLVQRRGRHPKGIKCTVRGGGSGEDSGQREPFGFMHARGGKEPTLFRRTWGNIITDNLAIAGGWTSDGKVNLDGLLDMLDKWLKDSHPTTIAKGYFVTLIYGRKMFFHEPKGQNKKVSFTVDSKVDIGGRYGAHSWFEDPEVSDGVIFIDMATAMTNIIGTPRKSSNGDKTSGQSDKQTDETPRPPDKDEDRQKEENSDPQRSHQRKPKLRPITELVTQAERKKYTDLVVAGIGNGQVHIVYHVPPSGYMLWLLGLHGGTGLLENYPKDSKVNASVHRRNVTVVQNCVASYKHYLKQYIQVVKNKKKIKTDKDLYNLGPPLSPFQFPTPLGANKDQRMKLYSEDLEASDFQAWTTIGRRLEDLFGMLPEGTIFLKFEFGVDSGNLLTPFGKVQAKWNFTVDNEGRIKIGPIESSKSAFVGKPAIGKSNWTLGHEVEVKKNEWNKNEVTHKVKMSIGPYGFEADQTGEVKMTGLYGTFAQTNPKTAITGYGVEFSLKDFILGLWEKRNPGRPIPEDIKRLPPDFKLSVGLFFQGLTVGTALAFTSRAPGFFERRPISELMVTEWRSLYSDERHHFKILKWDETTWNNKFRLDMAKYPKSARMDFYDLPADQKVAAVHMGLPARDPYWQNFWKRVAHGKPKK